MIVIVVLVMPIGMAVAMLDPIAFVIALAVPVMDVLRSSPVCTGIRRMLVVTGNPVIAWARRRPEASNPQHLRRGWRERHLHADRRRCDSDNDRDLRPSRRSQSYSNRSQNYATHHDISLRTGHFPGADEPKRIGHRS